MALIPSVLFVIVSGAHSDSRQFSAVGHCARVRLDSYTVAAVSAGLGVEARRFMGESHCSPLGCRAGYNKLTVSTQRKSVTSCLARAGTLRNVRAGVHRTDRRGVCMEARKERINLGVAGFALTILFFYFSNVMDKLGRSASLIGLGLLFLLGGWLLERTRRQLVARLEKHNS